MNKNAVKSSVKNTSQLISIMKPTSLSFAEDLLGKIKIGQIQRQATENSPYRAYMCEKNSKFGNCNLNNCSRSHPRLDLSIRDIIPQYKTKLCENYHAHGYCHLGMYCTEIHEEDIRISFARPILGRREMIAEDTSLKNYFVQKYSKMQANDEDEKIPHPILGGGKIIMIKKPK